MTRRTLPDPGRSAATIGGRSLHRVLMPAVIVGLLAAAPGGALAQAGLGEPAPDFTLTASGGEVYTLSEAFGRQVQLLHMIGFA